MSGDDGVTFQRCKAPGRIDGRLLSNPIGSVVSSRASSPSVLPPFPWVGLLTLAGAIFVSVTSEFLPTGLLPDMAKGLGVGVGTTGLLVSIFAGTGVAATRPRPTRT